MMFNDIGKLMILLSILLLATILVSCVFSGSETGFVSWNPLKVAHAASRGDFKARLAMRFLNNRGQFLSTVLIGNNVCNISSALIFGILFERIDAAVAFDLTRIPSPESLFLTPVLLIFSEVLPKSLYRTYPFRLTMKSVPFLSIIFFALSPFFWVFGAVSKAFRGGAGSGRGDSRNANVREEILLVAVEGARRGLIFESADEVMKNTLGMKGKCVGAYGVPLDEWRKARPVYRASQMISEFAAGGSLHADEIVIFDDEGRLPVGYVPLLDIAARRGGDVGNMTMLGSLMKPLPRVKGSMEILPSLRRMPPESPRFYAVVNNGAVTAVLDKMELFRAAFEKSK
jgi:CBS domain containing-hemolysin-like protein